MGLPWSRNETPSLNYRSVTPQPPGRTPHKAPQAPLRCPGGEDTPPEASEAPAREAMKPRDSEPGTLIVAATPLGRAADASPRLAGALAAAQLIAAEDTRRVRRLARELGVTPA